MFTKINNNKIFKTITDSIRNYISSRDEFIDRLNQKKYMEILGLNSQNRNRITSKDLHRAYLNQIKKFHADNVHNQKKQKQNQEITKCIIAAYRQLKSTQDEFKQSVKDVNQILKDQEEVSQALFGKKYEDIKFTIYADGHEEMRKLFLKELKLKKNVKHDSEYREQSQNVTFKTNKKTQNNQMLHGKDKYLLFGGLAILGVSFIYYFGQKSTKKLQVKHQKQVKQYTKQQLDVIVQNTQKHCMKSFQKFYDQTLKKRPYMLFFPIGKDPDIFEQLTKFSIAPDIHLFEVSPKYFLNYDENAKLLANNNVEDVQKYQLTETKLNTLLTLSLQAERALQNVYIKVDDILKQVSETGKYTPPKVFFKFHGYMMVQIRQKPFGNLSNYRNSKYISLFDLYFDFYSPIFFKRDYYNQYLVGFDQQDHNNYRYFGNVNINHRAIPTRYIGRDQKVVVMRDVKQAYCSSGKIKTFQQKYLQDWQNYYEKYELKWKQPVYKY